MPGEDINTTLRFTADITDFKAAMQEANRAVKLANSEFKAVSAGMDDWSGSTDGLTAKMQTLATVQEAEQRKLEVLKTAYQKVVEEQGENSAAAVELATKINNQQAIVNKTAKEYEKYSDKLGEVEKGADDATDDIKDVGDAAEEAGKKAEDSAEGWTIVKNVISDMVSKTVDWAIDSFKELMTVSSSAMSTLGARTGATTEQMKKYDDVMKAIYRNNYGESFEDVGDAMGEVIAMFGDLDKASLQNITEKAIALRDTFDMDYKESLRAVNSLMDQFGLTADEAFNLIAQGAQNGLNQNDDLLDTINEYSVQFKTAGYNADQMFNMLKNGAEQGTWSVDKLGDAVKEFNIRAKDGTVAEGLQTYQKQLKLTDQDLAYLNTLMAQGGESAQKAYGIILERLGAVQTETDRYQAGVALFGTMWEDLGEKTIYSLMQTQGSIQSTKGAMDELVNMRYDNLSDAMSGLGRVIQSDLIQPLVDKLEPKARDLVNWAINNIGTITPIIKDVTAAVLVFVAALAIQGLLSGVKNGIVALNAALAANPFIAVAALLAGLAAAFIHVYQTSEEFRRIVDGVWEVLKTNASAAVKNVIQLFKNLIAFFTSLPTNIANAIAGAVTKMTEWGRNLYNAAKNGVTNTITGIVTLFLTLPRRTAESIAGAVDSVVSWGRSLASSGARAAAELVSAVVNGVTSLPRQMLNIGANIVEGLWNGIWNKVEQLKRRLGNFAGSVLTAIQKAFGIHSPSTKTRWQGEMLVAGYLEALNRGKQKVAAAMRDLAGTGMDAFGDGQSGADGAGAGGSAGGRTIIFNQTNNSPRALSRREIYRQTHNALVYAGG